MVLPISVQVCTLNEEANIRKCLKHIQYSNPAEILVIDGGSSDRTVELVRELDIEVLQAGPIGLARQRRLGYLRTNLPYVAFIDADDRIPHNWLEGMLEELRHGNYSALQGLARVQAPKGFWERSWNAYFEETIKPTSDSNLVGRPALYVTECLKGLSREPHMKIEDTEMSRELELQGHRQGVGTEICYRICPTSIRENVAKWKGYGEGYRQFVREYPKRRKAILKHMFYTLPIERAWRPVARGYIFQPLFASLMTLSVVFGYLRRHRC